MDRSCLAPRKRRTLFFNSKKKLIWSWYIDKYSEPFASLAKVMFVKCKKHETPHASKKCCSNDPKYKRRKAVRRKKQQQARHHL